MNDVPGIDIAPVTAWLEGHVPGARGPFSFEVIAGGHSNLTYRVLCLVSCGAMVIRGGDRRMLAIAAAGTYVIYTLLTCLFYFVGLAYENVSEATRFILFMGALDAAWYAAQLAYGRTVVLLPERARRGSGAVL